MRCSKCNSENPEGKKFCGKCGSKLAGRCLKCGAENPPENAFCGECGVALAADAAPTATGAPKVASTAPAIRVTAEQTEASALDGERKTVTALFADIKGSMDLMEDLDPEEARAIVDPALKLMIDAVRRYDGYIVQSTGDGIFAIFGAPVAHEDHPQRALYAALRVQEEMRRYSAKLREAGNPPLEARVGVNTGETVVRSIKTGDAHTEYTPIGHSTSLASRMQALAPTGSIAVTEATRKLCEGYFILKALGPTRVKGVTDPVNVYEVTGFGPLRTRLQRSAGRGLTKFVGRQREMEAMKHAAEQAQAGRGQIVAAMAEAGVGKSRLFFEFKAISQSDWMVLETFSVSHGKASTYLPLIELLTNYFGIRSEDDERSRREKVAGRLAILDPSLEDTRPYIFALLGIVERLDPRHEWEQSFDRLDELLHKMQDKDPLAQMDPRIQRRRTLEAIKRIVIRESLNQPLIVIFEDLHWIDEATQEFLNLLADSIGNARLLLLVNYRPEYSHQWNSKTYYTQLRLDPLGKQSADEMLSALLGDDAGLVELKRVIIERTEGNPFFMEETVQVLLDEGALVREGAAVRLTKPLSELKIPPTVQAILAARIDRLPPDEKDLLQTLAVIGKEFSLSLVREVIKQPDDEISRMLNDLQLAEFVYEQPTAGDIEYIFKHALTQEVAYNSLLVERRKILHERTAMALEEVYRSKLDDHYPELAHHYQRSRDTKKAVDYLQLAGQQALQRSAYTGAIGHLSTALQLLQSLPESPEFIRQELLLHTLVGPALMAVKGYAAPEVETISARARELCRQMGDNPQVMPVLRILVGFYENKGELETARELARQMLSMAERQRDPAFLPSSHYFVSLTSFFIGDVVSVRDHAEQAVALYDFHQRGSLALDAAEDPGMASLSFLSWALWYLGRPDQALQKTQQALVLSQELSSPYNRAFATTHAAWLHQFRREGRPAQEYTEIAIALSNEHGFPFWLSYGTFLSGWAMTALGQHEEGIDRMLRGIATHRATGAKTAQSWHFALLAEAYLKVGRMEEALNALNESFATLQKTGERFYESELYRLKGELLLAQDAANAAQAEQSFRTAIEISRRQKAKSWELRATMSLARLLDKQGRRDEARAMLADIYNWFTEGFDTADLKDAKALLEELNG